MGFTLSNARRFYSSKGDPLGVKGLKTISLNPFKPKRDLIDFTLSNARRYNSSKGDPLGVKGLLTLRMSLFFIERVSIVNVWGIFKNLKQSIKIQNISHFIHELLRSPSRTPRYPNTYIPSSLPQSST